jgi:hypothetical protein
MTLPNIKLQTLDELRAELRKFGIIAQPKNAVKARLLLIEKRKELLAARKDPKKPKDGQKPSKGNEESPKPADNSYINDSSPETEQDREDKKREEQRKQKDQDRIDQTEETRKSYKKEDNAPEERLDKSEQGLEPEDDKEDDDDDREDDDKQKKDKKASVKPFVAKGSWLKSHNSGVKIVRSNPWVRK